MVTKKEILRAKRSRIGTRIRFLGKVIDFVKSIIEERGEEIPSYMPMCKHSRLINYTCFSFLVITTRAFGAELAKKVVKIYYHPGSKYEENFYDRKTFPLVLDASWYEKCEKCEDDIDNALTHEVDIFCPDKMWQNEIRKIIHDREEISDEIDENIVRMHQGTVERGNEFQILDEHEERLKII